MLRLESVHHTLPSNLKREARAKAIREGKNLSLWCANYSGRMSKMLLRILKTRIDTST